MSTSLIVGASGQVGEHLLRYAGESGRRAVGTCHAHEAPGLLPLDIRRADEVERLMRDVRPDVLYIPAAQTNVDYCEQHPEESYVTNVGGVRHLVRAANDVGARVVYFSSDYIFDGRAGPYREDDPPSPISVYGRQKVMAEHIVALQAREYLIVRTTVVYGWERQGKNFVSRLIQTLKAGQSLRAPVDQIGSPPYAPNLARAVMALVSQPQRGVFNVVGSKRANRYELACEAARVFGVNVRLIEPVQTTLLKQAAPRPLSAGLQINKLKAVIDLPMLGYGEELRRMASERIVTL